MLTPAFELSQDDESLIIYIRVPFAKISEVDVFFEDFDFKFYCKPYFLRLNLPGRVGFCEKPRVSYDVDKGTFEIIMVKVTPGEKFEDLDLLTKLLAPRSKPSTSTSMIEVIGDPTPEVDECDDDFDWELEQTPVEQNILPDSACCGFGNQYPLSVFKLKVECAEIFDIMDPDSKSSQMICKERKTMEKQWFSEDHYLADLYEDEEIQQLINFCPEWENIYQVSMSNLLDNPDEKVHFTADEKEQLRRLPNKEYLLENSQRKSLQLGLVDIIYAYAYNKRTTEGENTVESAWTINKLSATLSWLETFSKVDAVAQCCVRRSLCYPLFRNWELAMTVLNDTKKILLLGRKYVLKCLLEIHGLFRGSDPRYILNDLYITDYCVWIQSRSCQKRTLTSLAEALAKVHLTKHDVDLELSELEDSAELTLQDNAVNLSSPSQPEPLQHSSGASNLKDCHHTMGSLQPNEKDSDSLCLDFANIKVTENPSCIVDISNDVTGVRNSEQCPTSSSLYTMKSLDPIQENISSSSSSDSDSDTSSQTDSDDYSTSSQACSDDSDDDSSCSSDSDEHNNLLTKDNCCERQR